jgi:hypothetical protein
MAGRAISLVRAIRIVRLSANSGHPLGKGESMPFTRLMLLASLLLTNGIARALDSTSWEQSLVCERSRVVIRTDCVRKDADTHCPIQRLEFRKNDGGPKKKKFTFRHPYSDFPSFIASLSCVKKKEKNYVVATETNFGNCSDCEWLDIFDTNGRYLVSSKAFRRSNPPFVVHHFPKPGLSLLGINDAMRESSSITISRPNMED